MTQLTETEIKAAFSAIRARRDENTQLRKATLAVRTQFRSEAEKLLIPYWKKTGLDISAFEAAKERAQTEMRRVAQEQKEQAIARSASVAARLRSAQRRRLQTKLSPKFVPPNVLGIETASMISSTPGLVMDGSNMESLNNWAKVRGQWSSDDSEAVSFIFMWNNPNDAETVINVESYMALNGTCECDANSGWAGIFPGGNSSFTLKLILSALVMKSQPPIDESTSAQVFSLSANGGGWFDSTGAVVPGSVDGLFGDQRLNQLVLPPNAALVFEVALGIELKIDNGSAKIDFSSGSLEVQCPLVAIGILS
jgi:hypothetical protein